MSGEDRKQLDVIKGRCPNDECEEITWFSSTTESQLKCWKCERCYDRREIQVIEMIDLRNLFVSLLGHSDTMKASTLESVASPESTEDEVDGFSNFQCRLLSELFTFNKVNNRGEVEKILDTQGNETTFKCSRLSNYSFKIKSNLLNKNGFKIDGFAASYLEETLEKIKTFNNRDAYPIVPLEATGDGYCLMHAVSRCLVGRELFWHALITNLSSNMQQYKQEYQSCLKTFYPCEEFEKYMKEANPDYKPVDGNQIGLTFVHIFVLAHVLHRPIMLVDADMKGNEPYTGLFLPILINPDECKDKNGVKNPPILIAWNSRARNHFVPLVGIEDAPCSIPFDVLPRPWLSQAENRMSEYIDFNDDSSITFSLGKQIDVSYLRNLVEKMKKEFQESRRVSPKVVEDYNDQIKMLTCYMHEKNKQLISEVKAAIDEQCLFKCIICGRLTCIEIPDEFEKLNLLPDGYWYQLFMADIPSAGSDLAQLLYAKLRYRYDEEKDRLFQAFQNHRCSRCDGDLRVVKPDGEIVYHDGDAVKVSKDVSKNSTMIIWDGQLYDSMPERIELELSYGTPTIKEEIVWFYKETDPNRNSNAYEVADKIIEKYAELGSKKSQIVDEIIEQTSHLSAGDAIDDGDENGNLQPTMNTTKVNKERMGLESDKVRSKKSENETNLGVGAQKMKEGQKVIQKQAPQKNEEGKDCLKPNMNKQQINGAKSGNGKSKENPALASESSKTKSSNKTIVFRLKYSDKEVNVESTNKMTYQELQTKIEEYFTIKPEEQVIKTGFPRKTLAQPEKKDQPICVENGETVMVDRKVKPVAEEKERDEEKQVKKRQKSSNVKRKKAATEQHQRDSKTAKCKKEPQARQQKAEKNATVTCGESKEKKEFEEIIKMINKLNIEDKTDN